MSADRRTAVIAGILFILATAGTLAADAVLGSALKDPDFLSRLFLDGNRVLVSALLSFVGACASSGIAIALYPVLRKHSEGLALGAVGFRLIEGVFYTVGTICLVLLLPLSRQVAQSSGQAAAYAQSIGHLLLTAKDLAGFIFGVMAFCIGASMYYYVFYRSNLVPRWLSVWGLVAILVLLAAMFITLFDGEPYSVSGALVLLALPIALQEMVLAVWLIAKGFSASASAPANAKAGTNRARGRVSR